jgi:hypothetical protein
MMDSLSFDEPLVVPVAQLAALREALMKAAK